MLDFHHRWKDTSSLGLATVSSCANQDWLITRSPHPGFMPFIWASLKPLLGKKKSSFFLPFFFLCQWGVQMQPDQGGRSRLASEFGLQGERWKECMWFGKNGRFPRSWPTADIRVGSCRLSLSSQAGTTLRASLLETDDIIPGCGSRHFSRLSSGNKQAILPCKNFHSRF